MSRHLKAIGLGAVVLVALAALLATIVGVVYVGGKYPVTLWILVPVWFVVVAWGIGMSIDEDA